MIWKLHRLAILLLMSAVAAGVVMGDIWLSAHI